MKTPSSVFELVGSKIGHKIPPLSAALRKIADQQQQHRTHVGQSRNHF
jgi:hypothetical protein